ncbi:MAG: hypothetical protein R3E66_24475 [bacterium]
MHPFGKTGRFTEFFETRPWQPNIALLVLFGALYYTALEREIERCKCHIPHDKTSPGAFYFYYLCMLFLLFVLHFVVSKYVTQRIRQILLVVTLVAVGGALQQVAFDAAWSTKEEQQAEFERYNKDVTF